MRTSKLARPRLALAISGIGSALALAACGTADQSDLQNKIKSGLAKDGINVSSVSCPSGISLKKGTAFKCTVNYVASGQPKTATFAGEIVDSNHDFSGNLEGVTNQTPNTPATTTT